MTDRAAQQLLQCWLASQRMTEIVLEHLDPAAWRGQLPGCKGRTIAAIVAHTHNVRRKWLRLSAPHLELPNELDRATSTLDEARAALAESAARCSHMIADLLARADEDAKFLRDGWAKPWPAGPAMVAYMLTHEAHHRGQICMLARQLGFPIAPKTTSDIWNWEKLWRE